jgi:hypothetical protein
MSEITVVKKFYSAGPSLLFLSVKPTYIFFTLRIIWQKKVNFDKVYANFTQTLRKENKL